MTVIPETMPAVVFQGPGELEVQSKPVPKVSDTQVLIEVSHCGVCGSDLHMIIEGWGRVGSVGGHEWSGVVVAVGDAVREWKVGDEIVGGPGLACGQCRECRANRPSLCSGRSTPGVGEGGEHMGAFARYKRVDETDLLRLPEGVSLRTAALTEPLAVALHGINQAHTKPGDKVLVTGAGPIGALTIAALHARGVTDVTVSEPAAVRQELARRLGVERVIAPDELDMPGRHDPGSVIADPYDVVLECSGHQAAQEAGLSQLGRGGTLVLVGAGMARPKFDPNRILLNELVITGAFCYDHDGHERALELLARPDFPVDVLIEPDDVPLAGALDAMRGLVEGRIAAKVLIAPGAAS